MTEELYSHLAGFFSLAVQFRRHPLIYWGGRGERAFTHGVRESSCGTCFLSPPATLSRAPPAPGSFSLFPFYFLFSFFCRAFLPGATSAASLEERHNWPVKGGSVPSAKVLPASAGASQ